VNWLWHVEKSGIVDKDVDFRVDAGAGAPFCDSFEEGTRDQQASGLILEETTQTPIPGRVT
jgi:hypothetical protein